MLDKLKELVAIMPGIEYVALNLLVTIAILIIGWTLSSFAGRTVQKLAARSSKIDPTIVPMVYTVTVWAIRVFVIVAVLARFGVQTASIIAVLGAAGLAVGLALQGTLQNIAAGIMLLALRPLRTGEYISVVGKADGTVAEVGLFLTRLIQFDGVHLSLPNSLVWGNTIINYSRNAAGAEANGGGYVLTKTDSSGNRLGIDKDSYQTPAELFELGTKISLIEDKLFLGVSAYYQTYFRSPPGGADTQYKNKGIEVDLNYQPNRNFFATFSYGYIDSRTESAIDLLDFTTYSNIRTQGLPQNQFNALASYTFDNGFGASINGTLASEINNNYAGTIVIPWQFEIDASVFYTYKDWNFKVALLNVTDEENWAAPNGLYGSQSILAEEGFRTEFTVTYSF